MDKHNTAIPILAAVGVAICLANCRAEQPGAEGRRPSVDVAPTSAEQYRSLFEEYETAKQQYLNATRKATTDAEKARAREMRPDHTEFARRALDFAENHRNDPAALDALQWIAVELWRPGAEKELEKALEILVTDHIESEKLDRVCQRMAFYGSWFKPTQRVLREIIEKSPHHDVQGHACFALARHLGQLDLEAETRERQGLRLVDRERLRNERADLLKRVVRQYGTLEFDGDVAVADERRGNLGVAAQRELFELWNIAVGQPAPAIEGEDIDGERFKLSDYRGKVVLLNFWAFW